MATRRESRAVEGLPVQKDTIMTKLPDNVDVTTLSAADALAWYQTLAEGFVREDAIDLVKAWTKVKLLYPALAERANIGQPILSRVEPVGRYNDSTGLVKGYVPPLPYAARSGGLDLSLASKLMPARPVACPNEGNIEAIGLPRDCTFEEFAAADRANAGATPRSSAAIFQVLVGLQAEKGLSIDAARDAAQIRFPQLASEAAPRGSAANGDGWEASRKAHLASAVAVGKSGHLAAAAAHGVAAAAQSKAGDADAAEIHRSMVAYHGRQASRLETT
jgi:hypothetical protein